MGCLSLPTNVWHEKWTLPSVTFPSMRCGAKFHSYLYVASCVRTKWRRHSMPKFLTITIMTLSFAPPLLAQAAPTSTPPSVPPAQQPQPATSHAKSIGLFPYPKNQQSADQQLKDESE